MWPLLVQKNHTVALYKVFSNIEEMCAVKLSSRFFATIAVILLAVVTDEARAAWDGGVEVEGLVSVELTSGKVRTGVMVLNFGTIDEPWGFKGFVETSADKPIRFQWIDFMKDTFRLDIKPQSRINGKLVGFQAEDVLKLQIVADKGCQPIREETIPLKDIQSLTFWNKEQTPTQTKLRNSYKENNLREDCPTFWREANGDGTPGVRFDPTKIKDQDPALLGKAFDLVSGLAIKSERCEYAGSIGIDCESTSDCSKAASLPPSFQKLGSKINKICKHSEVDTKVADTLLLEARKIFDSWGLYHVYSGDFPAEKKWISDVPHQSRKPVAEKQHRFEISYQIMNFQEHNKLERAEQLLSSLPPEQLDPFYKEFPGYANTADRIDFLSKLRFRILLRESFKAGRLSPKFSDFPPMQVASPGGNWNHPLLALHLCLAAVPAERPCPVAEDIIELAEKMGKTAGFSKMTEMEKMRALVQAIVPDQATLMDLKIRCKNQPQSTSCQDYANALTSAPELLKEPYWIIDVPESTLRSGKLFQLLFTSGYYLYDELTESEAAQFPIAEVEKVDPLVAQTAELLRELQGNLFTQKELHQRFTRCYTSRFKPENPPRRRQLCERILFYQLPLPNLQAPLSEGAKDPVAFEQWLARFKDMPDTHRESYKKAWIGNTSVADDLELVKNILSRFPKSIQN